jgi:hypothetical protein
LGSKQQRKLVFGDPRGSASWSMYHPFPPNNMYQAQTRQPQEVVINGKEIIINAKQNFIN